MKAGAGHVVHEEDLGSSRKCVADFADWLEMIKEWKAALPWHLGGQLFCTEMFSACIQVVQHVDIYLIVVDLRKLDQMSGAESYLVSLFTYRLRG